MSPLGTTLPDSSFPCSLPKLSDKRTLPTTIERAASSHPGPGKYGESGSTNRPRQHHAEQGADAVEVAVLEGGGDG